MDLFKIKNYDNETSLEYYLLSIEFETYTKSTETCVYDLVCLGIKSKHN